MTLECTLVGGPEGRRPAAHVELTIDVEPGTAGEALEAGISKQFGTRGLTIDGKLLRGLTVGAPPLVNGAILVDDVGLAARALADNDREQGQRGTPGLLRSGKPALFLVVESGPDSGRMVQLRRGRYTLGRAGSDINLPDPDMSRRHAVLEVSGTSVTIEDLGSANGVNVDGVHVSRAAISTGSIVRCGGSTLSLVYPVGKASGVAGLDDAGSDVRKPILVQGQNLAGKGIRLTAFAVLPPIVVGIGMALMTGMWWFFALTCVSGLALLFPAIAACNSRRKFRLALAEAVARDAERRRKAAPSAADIALAHNAAAAADEAVAGLVSQTADAITPESPKSTENLPPSPWLRLGSQPGNANVATEPADSGSAPQHLCLVPVTFDPSSGTAALTGPSNRVEGLARFLIMQLAAFPRTAASPILLHGPAERLPLSARFLPRVQLLSDPGETLRVLSAGSPRRGFLFLYPSATAPTHASESQRVTAAVLEASALHGWQTIICGEGSNAVISTSIDVSEKEAVLRSGEIVENFLPDLLQPDVFDRFCRSAAKAGRKPKTSGVPDACSLWDLLDAHPKAIASRWAASERDNRLVAPIGQGRSGPQLLDLNRDGPHVLVAGTTGAGKSELLRTLVAALALIHPPDSVNFIFIDFKGGSGLAPLAGLPHCVGMLTDLGQDSLDRSLQSLRAEIRWRERLFALSNVPDLAAYRLQREHTSGQSATGTSPSLPHLVLVIDEFRMLVDEAPSALAELMRIAAIGRSLGLHLVMATQRPQGALTADIRANVTSSIALRVQSEADSHDILNSRLAAGISVSTPGRAYLARGSEGPEEFQTATFTPVSENPGFLHITIREAATALCKPETHLEQKQPATPTPSLAGAPLVAAVQSVWEGLRREQPRRPIAPPLPASVIFPEKPEDETEISIALGIADLPEEQRLEWLKWWPYRQGHLALVGTAFGTGKSCRAVAAALVSHTVESHMYVLDADGAFPTVASLERVGAVVMTNEPFRAARLLQRLAHEVSLRATGAGKSDDPPLVLVITGWGRWTASFRSGPYIWAEELVHELIRAGRAGGLAIVISGDRELIGARFFPALDTHAFFPQGSTEEARFSWPKLPDIGSIPGRAVVRGSATGGRSCVAQFAQPESDVDWPYMPARPALHKAFKVLPLPQLVTVDEVLKRRSARLPVPREKTEISGRDLWVGVGGDELEPASLRLIPGGSFLALGGPGSGKSTLMKVLPLLNPGQVWLRPGDTNDPAEYWTALWRNRSESRHERRETMLIDDFDRLSPECQHYLADLNRMGLAAVLTASLHVPLQGSLLASKARACGSGLLLAPRRLADGDFFGIRYEVEQSPPPGRAVLFRSGRPEAVQLAIDKHPS